MSTSDRSAREDKGQPKPGDDDARPPEEDTGRPSGPTDADGLRPGMTQEEAPTEAPEDQGSTPTTEHGPGGDL